MSKLLTVPILIGNSQLTTTSTSFVEQPTYKTRMDTGDYDGSPVYTFEATIRISSAGATATVALRDSSGNVMATLTHNSVSQKTVRGTFTPTSGSADYTIWIKASTGTMHCFGARILVAQTNPTK